MYNAVRMYPFPVQIHSGVYVSDSRNTTWEFYINVQTSELLLLLQKSVVYIKHASILFVEDVPTYFAFYTKVFLIKLWKAFFKPSIGYR